MKYLLCILRRNVAFYFSRHIIYSKPTEFMHIARNDTHIFQFALSLAYFEVSCVHFTCSCYFFRTLLTSGTKSQMRVPNKEKNQRRKKVSNTCRLSQFNSSYFTHFRLLHYDCFNFISRSPSSYFISESFLQFISLLLLQHFVYMTWQKCQMQTSA